MPGLLALIFFSCFNNFLGGVFMALMDAYGLSLVSVQAWGLLWGVLSAASSSAAWSSPGSGWPATRCASLLLVNVVLWTVTSLFPLRSSIVLLAAGMAIYMLLVPYAEAAEQTMLQKVVPYERQGRVFGFAQSVEQAASPLTAFLIAPIAQFVFIPFMTDGAGARTIGDWFGTGADRGIALVFVSPASSAWSPRCSRCAAATTATSAPRSPKHGTSRTTRTGMRRSLRAERRLRLARLRWRPAYQLRPADRDNGHGRVMTKGPHARPLERRSWTT